MTVEVQPRIAVGQKVGQLLSDASRPRDELIRRLAVARKLLEIWGRNPENMDLEWMPKILRTRLLVDAADGELKAADNVKSRAAYKEAGESFYALWADLSQSNIPPTLLEETADVIQQAARKVADVAEIGLGTVLLGCAVLYLVTRK